MITLYQPLRPPPRHERQYQVSWRARCGYHHQERTRPVFVSDLEGKILSANDAVYELLGFRTDQVLEQSLSRFISPEETREFTAALREVIERGATRNARLNPRNASREVIPTSLNASALRDAEGKVIGAIGILRDMRELDKARAYADSLIKNAPDPVFVSDLQGKIFTANDAVYELLGFRTDEVLEQSEVGLGSWRK